MILRGRCRPILALQSDCRQLAESDLEEPDEAAGAGAGEDAAGLLSVAEADFLLSSEPPDFFASSPPAFDSVEDSEAGALFDA